jgi:uncharacterized protein
MIILECISVFLASVIKGITGFGFNLLAVSALVFFLSPKVIVPVISLLSAISSLYLLVSLYKYIQIKRILPLMVGALIAIPFGVSLLTVLKPETLKVLIGFVITSFTLLFTAGYRKEIKNEPWAFLLIGLMSGVIGGSTSLGGTPVILFFINQDDDKLTFRANITLFYVIQSTASFLAYMQTDLITYEVIKYSFLFFIPMTLGILAGIKCVHKVNEALFRQMALIILMTSGIASIFTGLRAILR